MWTGCDYTGPWHPIDANFLEPDCSQPGNTLLSMNLMQHTLKRVRKNLCWKMSPMVGYAAKLWQGNEWNPDLLALLGHRDNALYFCIVHGNFLFISSIAAC